MQEYYSAITIRYNSKDEKFSYEQDTIVIPQSGLNGIEKGYFMKNVKFYHLCILIVLAVLFGILTSVFQASVYVVIICVALLVGIYFRTEYEKRLFVREAMQLFRNYREIMRDDYSLDDQTATYTKYSNNRRRHIKRQFRYWNKLCFILVPRVTVPINHGKTQNQMYQNNVFVSQNPHMQNQIPITQNGMQMWQNTQNFQQNMQSQNHMITNMQQFQNQQFNNSQQFQNQTFNSPCQFQNQVPIIQQHNKTQQYHPNQIIPLQNLDINTMQNTNAKNNNIKNDIQIQQYPSLDKQLI